MALYDCQRRVVYDTGDDYHIAKIPKSSLFYSFTVSILMTSLWQIVMALRVVAFHSAAKAQGLSRRLICKEENISFFSKNK